MGEQMGLDLRVSRLPGDVLRFDAGFPIHWRKVGRRARKLVASLVMQGAPDAAREGFAIRAYAEDAALLEVLRAGTAGKRLKQAARKTGKRLPVKAVVLLAASREGRRLHALVDRIEGRVATREAMALCG